jgi:hypothetical protein
MPLSREFLFAVAESVWTLRRIIERPPPARASVLSRSFSIFNLCERLEHNPELPDESWGEILKDEPSLATANQVAAVVKAGRRVESLLGWRRFKEKGEEVSDLKLDQADKPPDSAIKDKLRILRRRFNDSEWQLDVLNQPHARQRMFALLDQITEACLKKLPVLLPEVEPAAREFLAAVKASPDDWRTEEAKTHAAEVLQSREKLTRALTPSDPAWTGSSNTDLEAPGLPAKVANRLRELWDRLIQDRWQPPPYDPPRRDEWVELLEGAIQACEGAADAEEQFDDFPRQPRKLLLFLKGKSKIPLREAFRAVYGRKAMDNTARSTLLRLVRRTSDLLPTLNRNLTINKTGDTLELVATPRGQK